MDTNEKNSILITGASGLLGKYLMETGPKLSNVYGTWFTNSYHDARMFQMDITNKSQIGYILDRVQPDVIIHCAAIGSVDYAETNFSEAHLVNVKGTKFIQKMAKDYGSLFVYISSNAVFAGDNPPYSETSERNPVNRYGSIKRETENLVMDGDNWLIIRPFMLYGYPYPNGRSNPFMMFLARLLNKQPIKAVNDVWWQPTSAKDAARVIWRLIDLSPKNEIYNIAPPESMTMYDFAVKIAQRWGQPVELIEPVENDYFNLPASRPVDTSYDVSKLAGLGLEMLSVEEGLKELQ